MGKTQTDLKTREDEYSTNDETRTSEEGQISNIKAQFKKLIAVKGTGNIGDMPPSALQAAKAAVEALIQMNPRKETTKVLNLLQRPSAKVTSSETLLGELTASLTAERKKDTDAVDAQKKVAKATLHDQAKGRTATAKAVVKHEEGEYAKAQKIRDADLATIAKAKALIEELIKTE